MHYTLNAIVVFIFVVCFVILAITVYKNRNEKARLLRKRKQDLIEDVTENICELNIPNRDDVINMIGNNAIMNKLKKEEKETRLLKKWSVLLLNKFVYDARRSFDYQIKTELSMKNRELDSYFSSGPDSYMSVRICFTKHLKEMIEPELKKRGYQNISLTDQGMVEPYFILTVDTLIKDETRDSV